MNTHIPIDPDLLVGPVATLPKYSTFTAQARAGGMPLPITWRNLLAALVFYLDHQKLNAPKRETQRARTFWLAVYAATLRPSAEAIALPPALLVAAYAQPWEVGKADFDRLLQMQAIDGGLSLPFRGVDGRARDVAMLCRVMDNTGVAPRGFVGRLNAASREPVADVGNGGWRWEGS